MSADNVVVILPTSCSGECSEHLFMLALMFIMLSWLLGFCFWWMSLVLWYCMSVINWFGGMFSFIIRIESLSKSEQIWIIYCVVWWYSIESRWRICGKFIYMICVINIITVITMLRWWLLMMIRFRSFSRTVSLKLNEKIENKLTWDINIKAKNDKSKN